jgi:hypothetical protein
VVFKAAFEGKPTEPIIEVMAYLFGAGGDLMAEAPAKDEEVACVDTILK